MRLDIDLGGERVSIREERIVGNNMSRCHAHESYEFYFLEEGERYLFLRDKLFTVKAGDAFLISPGVEHRTIDSGAGEYLRITANISPSLIPRAARPKSDIYFVRTAKESALLLSDKARELRSAADMHSVGREAAVLSALFGMLSVLFDSPTSPEDELIAPGIGRMVELLKYLDSHYTEPITLASLSAKFYISEFYLCRLFKAHTGATVLAYVNDLRITKAKSLLATTDEKIKKIAAAVGFGSVSAFGKAFSDAVGESAREYRKRQREIGDGGVGFGI